MAGNYPDAPSWRMAWDRDGSTGFSINKAGAISELSAASKVIMNNEAGDGVLLSGLGSGLANRYAGVVFPEPRDVDGYWLNLEHGSASDVTGQVEVSADTTNGLDGTWAQIATVAIKDSGSGGLVSKPTYRTGISSTTQLAVRGIRVRLLNQSPSWTLFHFHLYGEPVPGANPNRLELWHPTLDEKLPPAYLDWGNVPRSSSADRLIRVKNLSTSQTAGQARVAMEVLTDGAPSVPAQHTLSYGGGSFLAQVNIGDLAPGAISGPVTVRRITPSNAQLGLWSFRVFAESTAWA